MITAHEHITMAPPAAADPPLTNLALLQAHVDFRHGEVRFKNGQRCALSCREAELLRYLACHPGRVVSRGELLQQVWRLNPDRTFTRTVDMHIAHLRDKLHDDHGRPKLIQTKYGQGYVFFPDLPQAA